MNATEFLKELMDNYKDIHSTDRALVKGEMIDDLNTFLWVKCTYDTDYDEDLDMDVDLINVIYSYLDSSGKVVVFKNMCNRFNKDIFNVDSYMDNQLEMFKVEFRNIHQ